MKKISDAFKKNYIFIILVDLYASLSRFFFGTRIQINVSWYGSGSDQMIRIRPDPDPKHCNLQLHIVEFRVYWPYLNTLPKCIISVHVIFWKEIMPVAKYWPIWPTKHLSPLNMVFIAPIKETLGTSRISIFYRHEVYMFATFQKGIIDWYDRLSIGCYYIIFNEGMTPDIVTPGTGTGTDTMTG